MNWETMSKEQKQKIILAVIVGLSALFAVYQFVITPWIQGRGQARQELEELRTKVETAQSLIRKEQQITQQLIDASNLMARAHRDYIPAADNALSWVTKVLYSSARSVGVDIESVSEVDVGAQGFIQKDQAARAFKPYSVRVVFQSSYAQLVRLLHTIEKSNPYLCVTGISIYGQPGNVERHQVNIVVEWPSWIDPAKGEALVKAGGK